MTTTATATAPWDWVGILGTGQSLSVGAEPASSTRQLYGNLMLDLDGAAVPSPAEPRWDPTSPALRMAPLVEPMRRLATGYPAPYPGNLFGETPHAAMANQISALVQRADPGAHYVTVHSVVGESGQGIVALRKRAGSTIGPTGRAYAASLFEVAAIARLAATAGKSYGVGAIVMTHGETDAVNLDYERELVQLLADYDADLGALTGQSRRIPMYLSQQFAYPQRAGERSAATLAQWRISVERPNDFVCTGPKFQYEGTGDGVHLSARGYQQIGEKTGQVFHERTVLGRAWRPLEPVGVRRSGDVIAVQLHVPVPPLRWDEAMPAPPLFANGRGFEVRGASPIPIRSVAIAGDSVHITCARPLTEDSIAVGYAMTANPVPMRRHSGSVRWGQLCDSDPFVGSTTNLPNPNYCVSFEMPVLR